MRPSHGAYLRQAVGITARGNCLRGLAWEAEFLLSGGLDPNQRPPEDDPVSEGRASDTLLITLFELTL
jgi:hypothetical protein